MDLLRAIGLLLGSILFQWLVLGRIMLWGTSANIVLLVLCLLSYLLGRRVGMFMGFGAGFLMDVIYDQWGIYTIAKTIMGFMVGSFTTERREGSGIAKRQAFTLGLLVALLHNGIMIILLAIQYRLVNTTLVGVVWLGSAVYTACIAFLIAAVYRGR
jgi:rod shape-determining protein MreD